VKISCPSCAAKYSIADDKVENRLAKIRCRKCSTTIVIDGKVNPANVYAADASGVQAEQPSAADAASGPVAAAAATPAPAAGGGGEYSVDFGDNDQRNLTLADLVVAYNAGEVTAETYIWTEGMADWAALGEVPEVVEALQSGAAPAAPAAAPTPAAAAPFGGGAPNFGAAPAQAPWDQGGAQADAVRAATEPGRGATADLFGGFDQAGGESDSVATSAPGPALGSGLGSGPAADPATGARNESSVLFSLSALTAAKDTSRPVQSSGTSATREDSGLIDLKALTSQAEASAPAVDPMMATAPPLGFAPPLGASPLGGGLASAQLSVAPPPKKSKMGLFIGAGIAFGAVVIAIAIVVSSSKEAPPPPPTAAATAAPAPAPTPTPTADTTVAAKPPATGTAEGENGDKPPGDAKTKVSARPTGGYKKPVGGQPSKPTGGASPAPAAKPAPKPKSACGCPPGDLQCAMRCAAGG
jgi:predicted Zn finger-like uncharacterized protein